MTIQELCQQAIEEGFDCTARINVGPVNELHGIGLILAFTLLVLAVIVAFYRVVQQ